MTIRMRLQRLLRKAPAAVKPNAIAILDDGWRRCAAYGSRGPPIGRCRRGVRCICSTRGKCEGGGT
jgi:hypothetical protein